VEADQLKELSPNKNKSKRFPTVNGLRGYRYFSRTSDLQEIISGPTGPQLGFSLTGLAKVQDPLK